VRPLVNRRWRTGTARLMPDDDPDQRSARCLPVGRGSRPHDRHLPADHPYRSRTRPRVELSHPVGPAGVSGPGERRAAGGSPAADDRGRTLARAAARLRCVSTPPVAPRNGSATWSRLGEDLGVPDVGVPDVGGSDRGGSDRGVAGGRRDEQPGQRVGLLPILGSITSGARRRRGRCSGLG
jgi:hypothetical protein